MLYYCKKYKYQHRKALCKQGLLALATNPCVAHFTWLYWYKSTNSDAVVYLWQGLVAFAAATGVMPLDMPESVLVRFTGKMQPGITLRDLVHAIPYQAIQMGLLTVEKKGKKNIFSGRILEIEGLGHLKCEQVLHWYLKASC